MSTSIKNDETTQEQATNRPKQPKRRRRWLPNLGWTLAGAALTVLLVADPFDIHPLDSKMHELLGYRHRDGDVSKAGSTEEKQLWTCGMHPQVIMEEPGQCPICGMDLVPLDGGKSGAFETRGGEREVLFYRNPMDPTITSSVPAKDEMGMDYVPVYAEDAAGAIGSGTSVEIDPMVVQNMNVRTELVTRRDLSRTIRSVGYLEYDQQRMVSVTTKYSGWIEKVYINYVGEPVRRGQPLFEIYSPELVQTQQELVSALRFASRMAGAEGEASGRATALVDAARARLAYWDISRRQVNRLEKEGTVIRTMIVAAPASGLVMKRMPGLEGMAVKPGMELFHIADLSTLWLSAEVFESQLPWIAPGSTAKVHLNYFPGEDFTGVVKYIEPQVNEKTRTVSLKLEIPNRDGRLRSGMYATAVFTPVQGRNVIAVPALALLRSGERDLVIVQESAGRFAPREVRTGVEGEDYIEIVSGLNAGETVVTSSQFLIDSESNLRAAIQRMIQAKKDKEAPNA